MSPKKAAPDEDVWWTGLKWVEAARMQLLRFEDATREWSAALVDAQQRGVLNDDSDQSRQWRASYDTDYGSYDPRRPLRVPTHALHIQLTVEADLLVVAVRNVIRAQARLPEDARTKIGGQDFLKDLRDLAEHFDEQEGRAATSLATNHAEVLPGTFAVSSKETWLGGIHGVPVSRLRAWLERVWSALTEHLEAAGRQVPRDLMASHVLGDDDLAWPPERLRYHWSIPQVEEQEWPRQELPEENAALLDERFLNLRSRDWMD
ncbi:hypothetical protein [Cellulomonas bogoriensis]|uniref:Uncharacterized protein n=1 Tax=Cellulomonas bogoriensis 69B4 = DSM 16987 TaxID=1386082 RepID=A0A0A0BN60_9CELL|nr:hypothetical protein [Cellulomonas bogoriensis]KGM09345.1 hypothetical protein N869_02020 [Cellulomonas bogoriensis 69B4 = DSM 16987]